MGSVWEFGGNEGRIGPGLIWLSTPETGDSVRGLPGVVYSVGGPGPGFFDPGRKKFPGNIFEMLMGLKPEARDAMWFRRKIKKNPELF